MLLQPDGSVVKLFRHPDHGLRAQHEAGSETLTVNVLIELTLVEARSALERLQQVVVDEAVAGDAAAVVG